MNFNRPHSLLLFESPLFYGRALDQSEIPQLQALFDANPEYFLTINGRPPKPDEAQNEFDERPPTEFSYTRQWFIGLFDREDKLIGVATIVSDLLAMHVWHMGLFLVATSLHGQGAATQIYAALEKWMQDSGAKWLRLGVVDGNARAERFWFRNGFNEVRTRDGVDTGGRINTIRVLVKLLGTNDMADYLQRVPRDRPDSSLP